MNENYVLITGVGAANGIGYQLASLFAKAKRNLIIVDNNEKAANDAADMLRFISQKDVVVIIKDLSRPLACWGIHDQTVRQDILVDVLINNAGFGTLGNFTETNRLKTLRMLDLNIRALTDLTHLFLSRMLKEGIRGKILNIASTSSFQPMPYMAAYGASKAYVYMFSRALNQQLKGSGVTVTALCPGPTDTGFWDGMRTKRLFRLLPPVSVEKVAETGYKALMKGKPMVIPGWRHRLVAFFSRIDTTGLAAKATEFLQRK